MSALLLSMRPMIIQAHLLPIVSGAAWPRLRTYNGFSCSHEETYWPNRETLAMRWGLINTPHYLGVSYSILTLYLFSLCLVLTWASEHLQVQTPLCCPSIVNENGRQFLYLLVDWTATKWFFIFAYFKNNWVPMRDVSKKIEIWCIFPLPWYTLTIISFPSLPPSIFITLFNKSNNHHYLILIITIGFNFINNISTR
jgi:hypothetical protein